MKRDCGKGELIPISWTVMVSEGQNDDEVEFNGLTFEAANQLFEEKAKHIGNCSSVRMYCKDKKGYMNWIRSQTLTLKGERFDRDRRNEL
jgi:hypothetical protein